MIRQRFFTADGAPLAGGKVYTYAAGTTTPQTTYSSAAGASNANPVILDANGEANIWFDPSLAYKVKLTNSADVEQWTVDSLPGSESLSQYGGVVGGTANAITLTPTTAITAYGTGQRFWFLSTGTNTTAATVAISGLTAKDIKTLSGAALTAGNITTGRIYTLTYDGVRFVLSEMGTVEDGAISTAKLADAALTKPKMDGTTTSASNELSNLSLVVSLAANALTVALKGKDGNDPSATNPVSIGFRNATVTTGDYSIATASAATSLVISSGSTLGQPSGVDSYVYIYAINNAGTVELAASSSWWDAGTVKSSSAEGGAGAADSAAVLYSTTARTTKAIRLIGRLKSNQAAAGTWVTAISEISLAPFEEEETVLATYTVTASNALSTGVEGTIPLTTKVVDTHGCVSSNTFTVKFPGYYRVSIIGGTDVSVDTGLVELKARVGGAQIGTSVAALAATTTYMYAAGVWYTGRLAVGDTIDARMGYVMGGNQNISATVSIERVRGKC